ncbi:Glycosyl transferase family 2 [Devosia sp. YR412]|uniref:glycosyltransferase family 2 protein n=1 Tax=Devosia sp. YR412 TaxID=1881030 RepID=UPI0008CD2AB4|nr:glycosyltransferase family A protein [Devosia sp. YR412]SEQ41979.1 Glycosyl transferase family 2 [Devosia sp. YR412]
MSQQTGLVHFRTPTYKRPEQLRRALDSMIAQTSPAWVCDVYDDDPSEAGGFVVAELNDPRIRYTPNKPQLFASRNIDHCFSADNPHGAEYFCVVEDDNFILPTFVADNIALMRREGVEIVLRNQLVEYASGTAAASVGTVGVLDDLFTDGLYQAEEFRLALLAGIGVSNGGLFWSVRARSPLEIQYGCTATLQEYLRTYSIAEPVYVAMEPLAVWAENAEQTTRNAELDASYLRRELDLKRAVQALRQKVWSETSIGQRAAFMTNPRFAAPVSVRATNVAKALIGEKLAGHVSPLEALRLRSRGMLIRALGRLTPEFDLFVASRDV